MRTLSRVFTHAPVEVSNARLAIFQQMNDGDWYTLKELAFIAGCSEAAASARVRDLRKPQYGSHDVESRPGYAGGPWSYRLNS